MDEKNFDVVRVMLPEYENAFIFDVVDDTNIAASCYLLCQKDNQIIVNKIINLITLLGDYSIESREVTNNEFNIFITLLKEWMNLDYNYHQLSITELDNNGLMEQINEKEYELIHSFVQYGSTPFKTKKH